VCPGKSPSGPVVDALFSTLPVKEVTDVVEPTLSFCFGGVPLIPYLEALRRSTR
jgi:hypothetical protein